MTSSPQFDSSLRAPSLTHNGGRALSVGISRYADATCLTFIPALWAAATMAPAWTGLSAAFNSRVRVAIRVAESEELCEKTTRRLVATSTRPERTETDRETGMRPGRRRGRKGGVEGSREGGEG